MRVSATGKKLNIFSILNIGQNGMNFSIVITYLGKFMLLVLTSDHMDNVSYVL